MSCRTLRLTRMGCWFQGRRLPCTIGRSGITAQKTEGDGATPAGVLRITGMLYRPDRIAAPNGWATPLHRRDLWSDDPAFEPSISGIGVTGICGSGVIEMVAEMRLAGLVDQTGRIGSPEQTGCAQCFQDGRTFSVSLYQGATEIFFTNNDLREAQMGKAALYASIRLLMDETDVQTVDKIVLAGAFGSHISPEHAVVLGLIPDCPVEHISAVGNAAGAGACMALLDRHARSRIETAVLDIRNIETATHPSFQRHFLNASDIPNALEPFPHLAERLTLPKLDFRKRQRRG